MNIRIALIGNMNNNHFALMRHLRDLGADAHLFLYRNELDHFRPQNDTTQWEKWRPFVHELDVTNGAIADLFGSLKSIERRLAGFDAYLGNGVSPVLFDRMGWRLNVFAPYGDGIEFIIEHEWHSARPLKSFKSWIRKAAMERSLKRSVDVIINANAHEHAQRTYRRLGVPVANLFLPMLYVESRSNDDVLTGPLHDAARRMDAADIAVFSHVSHFWKNLPVRHYLAGVGKRNQWLIEGFAKFVKRSGRNGALLVMVEYGPDVEASKALIRDHGISDMVLWLPLMTRTQIMAMLSHADIGSSEFAGMLWGSTGWEFLASGVPMLHYLEEPEAYVLPARPLPPFFNTASSDDIADVLVGSDKKTLLAMGAAARSWYDMYQGKALAKTYLDMLESPASHSINGATLA